MADHSEASVEIGRFAPSATGFAHPGTAMAALLCWLDARSRGANVVLRIEDLDSDRCRPHYTDALVADLAWLGLGWDSVTRQSDAPERYGQALDRLAADGLLYPCRCSRAEIRAGAVAAPGGGYRYPNTCRARALPSARDGGWRGTSDALRVRLPDVALSVVDESGADLSENPLAMFGDPVVRRRDAAPAYHLASVVDDHTSGVTRIVRGRDLALHTATQVALQQLLGLSPPRYRHHLLLLEPRGEKLAKLHGSVSLPDLKAAYGPAALCGVLAHAAGLLEHAEPATPESLIEGFSWERVAAEDRVLDWNGERLSVRSC